MVLDIRQHSLARYLDETLRLYRVLNMEVFFLLKKPRKESYGTKQ